MKIINLQNTTQAQLISQCIKLLTAPSLQKTLVIFIRDGKKFNLKHLPRSGHIATSVAIHKDFTTDLSLDSRVLSGVLTHCKNPNQHIFLVEARTLKQALAIENLLSGELQAA